jgi:hypothetical protein
MMPPLVAQNKLDGVFTWLHYASLKTAQSPPDPGNPSLFCSLNPEKAARTSG